MSHLDGLCHISYHIGHSGTWLWKLLTCSVNYGSYSANYGYFKHTISIMYLFLLHFWTPLSQMIWFHLWNIDKILIVYKISLITKCPCNFCNFGILKVSKLQKVIFPRLRSRREIMGDRNNGGYRLLVNSLWSCQLFLLKRSSAIANLIQFY